MRFNFDKKLFILLFLGFVIFTIIGTVTHELGHYTASKILGFKGVRINYGATIGGTKSSFKEFNEIYKENKQSIEQNLQFPRIKRYEELKKSVEIDRFWSILGGPLQTMLFGTIGFLLLFFRKKKTFFKLTDWLITFLSLFWLREVFNLLHSLAAGVLQNKKSLFGTYGDEVHLSKMLGIWEGTIPLLFGTIGLLICMYVIFYFIPKKNRFTFVLSGCFGGIFGFWFWLSFLGPIIRP